MARNISKMSRSPKQKTMNVAFWGKKKEESKKEKPKSQMQEALDHNKNLEDLINQM